MAFVGGSGCAAVGQRWCSGGNRSGCCTVRRGASFGGRSKRVATRGMQMVDGKEKKNAAGAAKEIAVSMDDEINEDIKNASASTSNKMLDTPDYKGYSMRTRLREETEAPFRKVRLFVYSASAASAALGGFVSLTRVIAALSGVQGTQPLDETIPNVLIDLGVVLAAVVLIRIDNAAGRKRLDRLSRGAALAKLKVENTDTGVVNKLSAFRLNQRPVLVCGDADTVNTVMADAFPLRRKLAERDVILVPFVTGSNAADDAVFDSWEAGPWLARPVGKEEWGLWFKQELDNAKLTFSKVRGTAMVIIVRKDGRVGARSMGPPMWQKLIEELDALPQKDRFGRP
uniref:Uncharacterized protein n=1 Tax=Erythrolobus madagascarensis TaxID=708628 RepID=A0A7S0T3M3_9RHOD